MNRNLQPGYRGLVEGCLRGDREALNQFYIRFAPKMLGVIHRYVPGDKDAEDILHDGFIVAFTRLSSLRDCDRVDYWLASIMRNLSLQFLQSRDVAEDLGGLPDVEEAPDIADIIDLEVLEMLMQKLPAGYQKVFRLAVLENKSHKEIARILGIAPNSSSSQLFHARLMMRRLVTEYRRQAGKLGLLLIAAVGAFLYFGHGEGGVAADEEIASARQGEAVIPNGAATDVAEDVAEAPEPSVAPQAYASVCVAPAPAVQAVPADTVVAVLPALPDQDADMAEAVDSIPATIAEPVDEPLYAEVRKSSAPAGWSVGAAVDVGWGNLRGEGGNDDFASGGPGSDGTDIDDKETRRRANGLYQRDCKDVPHKSDLPVSVSVSVSKSLTSRLSIETGLTYTYLHTFLETNRSSGDCYWHYLGIPVKLNLSLLSTHRVRIYGSVGARMDIPLSSYADVTGDGRNGGCLDLKDGAFSSPLQWSLSAGCGVSLRCSGKTEIFLEPTLNYNFRSDYSVPNIWTDNPWNFSLPVGFRFTW
ncbi:MAG: sigma-70 family RNA polymerase sigma factor [Duncaniella sp.]|nr:sigma-70 family RNA polymerase sigma factor [Duncaniella sp.]